MRIKLAFLQVVLLSFVFLISFPSAVSQTDIVYEFSTRGYSCQKIDSFYFSTWRDSQRPIDVIKCQSIDDVFFLPVDKESQKIVESNFEEILQLESARQNLYRNKLSNQPFKFEYGFGICKILEPEPPSKQITNGIVDVTDSALPYIASAEYAAQGKLVIKGLRALELASRFNVVSFAYDLSCSDLGDDDEEIITNLNSCNLEFASIYYGDVSDETLDNFNRCYINLLELSQNKGGVSGLIQGVKYTLNSITKGGNTQQFIQSQKANYDTIYSNFSFDLLQKKQSVNKLTKIRTELNNRIVNLEEAISNAYTPSPFRKIIIWFSVNILDNEPPNTYNLTAKLEVLKKADYLNQPRTTTSKINEIYAELLEFCITHKTCSKVQFTDERVEFRVVQEEPVSFLEYYNITKLHDLNRLIFVQPNDFIGLGVKEKLLCGFNCTTKIVFNNMGDEALIDVNITLHYKQMIGKEKFQKAFNLTNLVVTKFGIDVELTWIDETNLSQFLIYDITSELHVRPNSNYNYTQVELFKLSSKLENLTRVKTEVLPFAIIRVDEND